MQMWVPKASMSFPGLELPTRLKHMLPVPTEAWHFSSSWKGLRREVDGARDKDTAWGPCQGYCRHRGGWKLQGQDSKASRFCHSFFDARFLVYSFRHEIQSPEFCSESWWPSEMPAAVGTDDLVHITAPGLGALSFLTMGDWEFSYIPYCSFDNFHFL